MKDDQKALGKRHTYEKDQREWEKKLRELAAIPKPTEALRKFARECVSKIVGELKK